MGRKVDVDYIDLKETGYLFENHSNELKSIAKGLTSCESSVSQAWSGEDSKVFISKLDSLATTLLEESSYLSGWAKCMEDASIKYQKDIEDGVAQING